MIYQLPSARTLTLILAFLSAPVISGCSIVGYGMGRAIDHSRPDERQIEAWEMGEVDEGTTVSISTKDNSLVSGDYRGLAALPDSVYKFNYRDVQKDGDRIPILPPLDDTVRISIKGGNSADYSFRCFIYKYGQRTSGDKDRSGVGNQYVLAKPLIGDGLYDELPLRNIQRLETSTGAVVEGDSLRGYARDSRLPLKTAIVLKYASGAVEQIPINGISSISIPVKKHTGKNLFIAGLAVDVLTVLFLATLNDNYKDLLPRILGGDK